MWPLVTYSNYIEIASTVTFLDLQTGLISGIFYLILYYYIIDYQGIIFAAPYCNINLFKYYYVYIYIAMCICIRTCIFAGYA